MLNFLLPRVPFKYILGSFKRRRLTTGITVLGIALVVFVFAAVLMMSYGVTKTLAVTGSDENALVARKSSQGEISSIIDGETANIILSLPQVAKTADGRPMASGEPVVVINLEKYSGGISNVTVRGVNPDEAIIKTLRPKVKIVQGAWFKSGARELIVGGSIAKRFMGAGLGDKVKFAGDEWSIVGVFEADGSGFESEVWGDAQQLQSAFNRGSSVSTMTLRLQNPDQIEDFKKAFETDRRLLQFEGKTERKFFAEQSEFLAIFISILGTVITVIFSIGATIGAVITMYASVANRTTEIGTFRALGFRRLSVLGAFLLESMILSVFGGAIGLFLASFLQFFTISTINFNSFAELAFSFALSPEIAVQSLFFSIAMGLLGGFFPARRAARLNIVDALRSA